MNGSLQLGPLAMPIGPLLLALAAGLGLWAGKLTSRRSGLDPEPALLRMLLLGLLVARLAFVWTWRHAYWQEPLTILDIRDGGWNPAVGLAASCLYALALAKRQPALRRSLAAGLATTFVIGTAGAIWLWSSASNPARLPALDLPALGGGNTALRSFTGKPIVINLWATWCPPCRREMPLLHQAQTEHPGVNFVFINQGEDEQAVTLFLQAQHLPLRNVLLDKATQVGAAFDSMGLPTTLFIDAQGKLVSTHLGALSKATLARGIDGARFAPAAPSPSSPPSVSATTP
ncbi:TlpA disulfide reductase family protein [Aquabacterium sp.]|uniref:TlpA family protein disulfide reductase n=1 Tax=Aquabacterium sp. TaxID=1872578 RepID=UPI00198A39C6|nr:TlpA disulfide reductase family protein [Aquabacterium sp.]MBC7699108.1 TlpA family protein disulfide reductase [Aquabacterium sp.]